MTRKTYTTAVVIIPPGDLWPPIQAIRQIHDRHARRWMPHITMIYPFRPPTEFAALTEPFAAVCERLQPFDIELEEFHSFRHTQERYTLWLAPEPKEVLLQLQTQLTRLVPDCDEVTRHRDGFTPHLSVGQQHSEEEMMKLRKTLQAGWRPLAFTVRTVSFIWRNAPPDDVFRVGLQVSLGSRLGNAAGA